MTAQLTLPHLSQPLKLWEKLEIITGEGDEIGIYTARIEDFVREGIVISTPEFVKGHTLLRDKASVRVVFTKEDAAYQCQCRISKYPDNSRNLFLLSRPSKTKRVQRRAFVRVDMLEAIRYTCLSRVIKWEDFEEKAEWISSRTENMSGGGLLMKPIGDLETGTRLLIKVGFFPGIGLPETVCGIVRRIFTVEKCLMAGIEFIVSERLADHFNAEDFTHLPAAVKRFDRRAQNRLVSYIFRQEIELRKKGLL